MDVNIVFSDIALEERVKNNEITIEQMQLRSKNIYDSKDDNLPLKMNDEYGCPVCYSKLSIDNRLVREMGYIVCDYCVSYVEDDM